MPAICVLCHQLSDRPQDLCQACKNDMPILPQTCPRCAKTFTTNELPCGECLQRPPPYDSAFALFAYQKPITKMIMNLKFQDGLVYANLLGEWLGEALAQYYQTKPLPELIIPMPLHPQRLRERGFNQAIEIARPIAKRLKIPLDFTCCQRIRATAAQARLPAAERRRNVKNAFTASPSLAGRSIALLDDVGTTGHSMAELARACQKAGAARITVWYCARAQYATV